VAPGVALAVGLSALGLHRWRLEHQREATLLAYRNGVVRAELARVETALGRSPPQTVADIAAIVGVGLSTCDDKNEPGPLDDPRIETCPKGSACHEAFYMADWYVRRRIEAPDTRVWFDRNLEVDNSWSRLRVRVAGCEPGDRVMTMDPIDPARFDLGSW
jgi:hypothetical protein